MKLPLSRPLHALADPTRREIVRLLGERDMTAGEIAAHFDISAPSISHHLSVLKQAELVQAQRAGQTIVYSLNATVVQEFLAELLRFFKVGDDRHASSPLRAPLRPGDALVRPRRRRPPTGPGTDPLKSRR